MRHHLVPSYLTGRGWVDAPDLTVDEVVHLAPVFHMADARLLSWDAVAALGAALGLDIVRLGRVVVGRFRGRR